MGRICTRQTLDLCIAVLFGLVVTYAVTIAIEKRADRESLRNVIDSLINNVCTHDVDDKAQPMVDCSVT